MSSGLAIWVGLGVVFLLVEIAAYFGKIPVGTLSELVWRFLGLGHTVTPWVIARRVAFAIFWAWLTVHFWFQVM